MLLIHNRPRPGDKGTSGKPGNRLDGFQAQRHGEAAANHAGEVSASEVTTVVATGIATMLRQSEPLTFKKGLEV